MIEGDPGPHWKLITLTLRHSNKPLTEQIAFAKKSFRQLRQRKLWKDNIRGGVFVIEISRNEKTEKWHPHIHVLARGSYIANRLLSKQWLQITRTSMIVDVRAITKADYAVRYICKYLTKAPSRSVTNDTEALSEYITALHGARLIQRFGDAPKYDPPQANDDYPTDWEPIKPLVQVLANARYGIQDDRLILNHLTRKHDEPVHPDLFEQASVLLSQLPGGS